MREPACSKDIMRSSGSSDLRDRYLDLEALPSGARVSRREQDPPATDLRTYLRFLAGFHPAAPEQLRGRKGLKGEAFVLKRSS